MFDIHQKVVDKYGEQNEERVAKYIDGLMEEFATAPEAKPFVDEDEHLFWPAALMEYGFGYIGVAPPEMSVRDFNEVVFGLFPRKVSVEADQAEEAITQLRAFWTFLQRQYHLANAAAILKILDHSAVKRLHQELSNPKNFGMAKSFFTMGSQLGFDMSTQQGLDAFMLYYNSQLLGGGLPGGMPGGMPEPREFEPDPVGFLPFGLQPSPLTHQEKAKKRKQRKQQRQAKKRNRRR